MKAARLRFSGLELSPVTFGCWELGGGKWAKQGDEDNIEMIRTARDLGITLFDTAVNYGDGHSERVLGEALSPIRDRCLIATKVRPEMLREADVYKSVEGSLKRLKTDVIDILYVHWPNDDIPLKETMSAFQTLKKNGVIRAVGVSNFSIQQLKEACEYAEVEILQMEYSLLKRDIEAEIVPFCIEKGIVVTSYSTNAKGILTGRFHHGDMLPEGDFRTGRRLFTPEHLRMEEKLIEKMEEIAARHEVKLSQVALNWALNRPGMGTVIFGTQNKAHLAENIAAADIRLSPEDMRALTQASDRTLMEIDG